MIKLEYQRMEMEKEMAAYKKSKETREKILEIAKMSFYEVGFKKTTMRSIALKAGLNQALAYYYFTGKYDIAHEILDEYHEKVEKIFKAAYKEEIDPLLYLFVLYRYSLRELYENKKDFDFYVSSYQESYFDRDLAEKCKTIGEYYHMNLEQKRIDIAVISTSSSWGQLYTNKEVPYEGHFSHRDIMDAIDIMRFTYLGFGQNWLMQKINDAYKILETLPEFNIPILSPEKN